MQNEKTQKFICAARKIHGDKYDYSLSEYTHCQKKLKIICPIHGEFLQTPTHHTYRKQGCGKCRGAKISQSTRRTTEEFIKESKLLHGNKFNYSDVVYIKDVVPVLIGCPIHGKFKITPASHLNKKGARHHGCPKCGRDSTRSTQEHYINRVTKVHGDTYDYTNMIYETIRKPITIKCKIHGEFTQNAKKHLLGQGCPICSTSGAQNTIARWLKQQNIEFIGEYKFDSLFGYGGGRLRFDFYLPTYNMCIEYDGAQHFYPLDYFGGKNGYDTLKKHDKMKTNYCKDNNIKLIRISYLDNIEETLQKCINNYHD